MRRPIRRGYQPKKPTKPPKGKAPKPPTGGSNVSPYKPASRKRCPHCGRYGLND